MPRCALKSTSVPFGWWPKSLVCEIFQSTFDLSQNMPRALTTPAIWDVPSCGSFSLRSFGAVEDSKAGCFSRRTNRPGTGRVNGDAAPSSLIEVEICDPTVAAGVAPKSVDRKSVLHGNIVDI